MIVHDLVLSQSQHGLKQLALTLRDVNSGGSAIVMGVTVVDILTYAGSDKDIGINYLLLILTSVTVLFLLSSLRPTVPWVCLGWIPLFGFLWTFQVGGCSLHPAAVLELASLYPYAVRGCPWCGPDRAVLVCGVCGHLDHLECAGRLPVRRRARTLQSICCSGEGASGHDLRQPDSLGGRVGVLRCDARRAHHCGPCVCGRAWYAVSHCLRAASEAKVDVPQGQCLDDPGRVVGVRQGPRMRSKTNRGTLSRHHLARLCLLC